MIDISNTSGDITVEAWFNMVPLNKWHHITITRHNDVIKQYIDGVEHTFLPPVYTIPKSKSKYKFSRAKWYDAKFDVKKYAEIKTWCIQQFGPLNPIPDAWSRWFPLGYGQMRFRDEKDYILFVLRWGS